jgi:hypothetical protein
LKKVKNEYKFISCCGKYYCAFCDYYKGTIVKAAENLLAYAKRYGSLRLILNSKDACDFNEFMKGLEWIGSQNEPCKGCRFGGGWSWWKDCPVRECTMQKGISFCYECQDFPCRNLTEEPLLERKKEMIETNNKIKAIGIESWMQQLKKRYGQK